MSCASNFFSVKYVHYQIYLCEKKRCLPLLYAKLQTSQPICYTSPSRGHILKVKVYKDYNEKFFLKKLDFIYI